ncbi:ataxin-10 isoform X2 [Antennarius striatus]|uniref:ataxin-10 isoform X2 n=1 Tax=Antennarius striatus TaxID=241820 RepID=UPI0035ADF4CF
MAASPSSVLENSAVLAGVLKEKRCKAEHLQTLKTFTAALKEEKSRDAVDDETFSSLFEFLSGLCDGLHSTSVEDQDQLSVSLQLTAESFRAQRNSCIQNPRNQKLLRRLGFIGVSVKILSFLLSSKADKRGVIFEPLRCGIQFLGNVAVGNQKCKDDIWQQSFPTLFLQLLAVADDKAVNYTTMVLHTCLDEAKVEQLCESQNIPVALRVMELCRTHPDLDWTILIATTHFFNSPTLVKRMYCGMPHLERVSLLELILAQLTEDPNRCGVHRNVAAFLSDSFRKDCGDVLMLATDSASSEEVLLKAQTVTLQLDILCEMTSDLGQFMFLQNDPDLLKTTVELLEQVHAVGKANSNVFSAAQNFSSSDEDSSFRSPVINFKAHLIRLIGNLCHGNASNQNKVRDLDGIPLILDNCNVDSNNPFFSE